jgi:hypothetical protein
LVNCVESGKRETESGKDMLTKSRLSSNHSQESSLTDNVKQGNSGNRTGWYMTGTSQQAWFILLWEIFGDHNQINSKLKFLCKAIKSRLLSVYTSITFSQDFRTEREIEHTSETSQSDYLGTNDVTVEFILKWAHLSCY